MNQLRKAILNRIKSWCIDHVEFKGQTIKVSGWIGMQYKEKIKIRCNGVDPLDEKLSQNRPDLKSVFSFWEESEKAGFECIFESPKDISNKTDLCFSLGYEEKLSLNSWHDYFFPLFDKEPFPDASSRTRVHGNDSLSAFKLEGYSAYKKVFRAMAREIDISSCEKIRVLDWGCGCGRVARYFDSSKMEIWGADVDQGNLYWSETHLGIKTKLLNSLPPCSLPKNYFDCIFGISVMSHLDSSLQKDWLEELALCLKPDGVMLLSIHGISAALRGLPENLFRDFLSGGFLSLAANHHLDDSLEETSFYKDTFTDPIHVVTNWCKSLQLSNYLESVIGNHQDLVALRKISSS
jgi:2-polyprenyl-3-methyl-5-hydroxy-6-metoxy-1,4-benzoquinol methylase